MRTEIYFLRHGQTYANQEKKYFGQSESELTSKGKESISQLREVFNENIDVVISSDLQRCFNSSLILMENKNIPVFVDDRLRELNFGVFEGLHYEDLCLKFPEESKTFFAGDFNYVIPNGESVQMLFDRCLEFFKEIVQKYRGKQILLSTHSGPICALLSHCLTGSSDAYWKFKIPNGSITKLVHIEDFLYIEYMGLSGNKKQEV